MPCYMTGSAQGDAEYDAEEARKEATKLTRLLCRAARYMIAQDIELPYEVTKWWIDHKQIDMHRKKKCEPPPRATNKRFQP